LSHNKHPQILLSSELKSNSNNIWRSCCCNSVWC